MHTEKQAKDTPSRMFQQPEGKGTQQFRFEDNRESAAEPMADNRPSSVFQAKWMNNISCMQRKLPNGVTYRENTARVWLGNIDDHEEKSDGIMCNEINLGESKNKAEALKNISAKSGDIGASTRKSNWVVSGTDKYKNLNSAKLNPFQVPIKTTIYPIGEDDVSAIKLYYHYGPFNYGYIVDVVLNNGAEAGEMTYNIPTGNQYSNAHDTTDNSNKIIDQTNDKTPRKKYDAYTKLAGEGARFQCVRNHIENIKNESKFFAFKDKEDPKKFGQIKWIDYQTLWRSWGETFNCEFDISNTEVIKKISIVGVNQDIKVNDDFNLDENRAAEEEDKFVLKTITLKTEKTDLQIFQNEVIAKKFPKISSFKRPFDDGNEYDIICHKDLEAAVIETMIDETIKTAKASELLESGTKPKEKEAAKSSSENTLAILFDDSEDEDQSVEEEMAEQPDAVSVPEEMQSEEEVSHAEVKFGYDEEETKNSGCVIY